MSPTKLRLVLAFALAFSLLTLFEVVTQREDWPLSCYPPWGALIARLDPLTSTWLLAWRRGRTTG